MRSEFKSVTSQCGKCSKIIIKPNGISTDIGWFCSEACLNKSESELEEFPADHDPPASQLSFQKIDPDPNFEEEPDLDFGELI